MNEEHLSSHGTCIHSTQVSIYGGVGSQASPYATVSQISKNVFQFQFELLPLFFYLVLPKFDMVGWHRYLKLYYAYSCSENDTYCYLATRSMEY